MRFFFYHFYHRLAWTYDSVAAIVSVGRWNDWITTVLPHIQGTRLLELGYGTGYLQCSLFRLDLHAFGLDESRPMGLIARRRLSKAGFQQANLTRGLAQTLPFPAQTFDTIVATFPPEFIFEKRTLSEARRVLRHGGRLIVVPAAWILSQKIIDRSAAWLFTITGQAPAAPYNVLRERIESPFEQAGFKTDFQLVEVKSSLVMVLIART